MKGPLLLYLGSTFFLMPAINSTIIKTYQVRKIKQAIEITGIGSDSLWEKAEILNDFSYPWRDETSPATIFKALWNENHLFFLYRAHDPDIITKKNDLDKWDVVDSDRVEIFFKANDQMNPYYSLEMDALGRILDTEGRFYRKIDFAWNWPKDHLQVMASIDEDGYWVEGAISLESLRQLGMYQDDQILHAGLYRAEYVKDKAGTIYAKWISWMKPDSPQPDFHIPSSFGIFKLMD